MKLIYGRQLLKDLNITDPGDYGFDTFQFVNMHSNSTLDAVENEVGIVDDYYDRAVDFVLSMDLMGDPRCGSNSDSGNRGTIDRDQDESAYEDVQDNHQDEWINWMDGIAKNKPRDAYLDRGTARQLPWQGSFAFWNDWKKNDSDTENVTAEEQQRYMNNVRATLT